VKTLSSHACTTSRITQSGLQTFGEGTQSQTELRFIGFDASVAAFSSRGSEVATRNVVESSQPASAGRPEAQPSICQIECWLLVGTTWRHLDALVWSHRRLRALAPPPELHRGRLAPAVVAV
jgi:hypothetical protein